MPVPSPGSDEYPYDTPDRMWPGLAPFVPAGTRWTHSEAWTGEHAQKDPRWKDLYLSLDRTLAFVVLYDH